MGSLQPRALVIPAQAGIQVLSPGAFDYKHKSGGAAVRATFLPDPESGIRGSC